MSGPSSEARFVVETGPAAEVAALAEPVLESLGFRLVLVRIMGGQSPVLEIMAERPDGSMSIEDCKTVSLGLSPVLDVADPLPMSYRLQISSPGIDRPLVRPSDFDQWAGYEAKVELKEAIDGRRRFRGLIEGLEGEEVRIEVDLGGELGEQVLGLPLKMIGQARLVLTEELVRNSLRRARQPAGTEEPAVAPEAAPGTPEKPHRQKKSDPGAPKRKQGRKTS